MSKSLLGNFHLSFVEDFLPVGIAIFDRVKKGGASKVIEGFTASEHPMEFLRVEGTSSALLFRQKLDQIRPGLGNPALDIEFDEESKVSDVSNESDHNTLLNILNRMNNRVDILQRHINNSKDLYE